MNKDRKDRIKKLFHALHKILGIYKKEIILLTFLSFIGGLMEGIGINAIIPLFAMITGSNNRGDDFISKKIGEFFNFIDIDFSLKYVLIFICILFIFKAILTLINNYLQIIITTNFQEKLRNDVFAYTAKANWPYLLKQKVGILQTSILVDTQRSGNLLLYTSGIISILTSLIIYIFIALNISILITLITLIIGAVFFFAIKPLMIKSKLASTAQVQINKDISHFVNENIIGIKTIKTTYVHDEIINIAKDYFAKIKYYGVRIFFFQTASTSILQPFSVIFVCIIFAISYKTPNFQFASLVAIIYIIQKIFQYFLTLQKAIHYIFESVPYFENITNYKNESKKHFEQNTHKEHFRLNDEIEFKNVSFSYENGNKVFSGINFKIRKGEMIGVIGPSGGGKTTIVDMLLRLYNPTEGNIYIDGIDAQKIDLYELRNKIGYVSQDIFLKNATIKENIKFYKEMSDEEMIKAAKQANIHDFIEKLPNKYNTEIGERGMELSAGQRQRVVIARVLARKPEFLILDEATSALDNESEAKIKTVIQELKGNITILAIAHRLSTIIHSDKILVIEKGRIKESGNPQELLKNDQTYLHKVYNIRD